MKESVLKVGITQGDINGIGYEVIMKTLMDNRILEFCTPVIYGSPKVAAYHRKALNIENFSLNNINHPHEANFKRVNIINCLGDTVKVELGKESLVSGESAFKAIELATDHLKKGAIDVLVTAPVNKHSVYANKIDYAGHTEYLSERMNAEKTMTILVGSSVKIGVVTGHVPMSKLANNITVENILEKLRIMHNSLEFDFSIRKPKIAVLGLNPHLGDKGMWGEEEAKIIIPAIEKAREEGIMAIGPFSADGFFGAGSFKKFDAVLAMYHDQGMIPFKTLEDNRGVVFTAGLPKVRTSPAHGTAYEVVGKGIASEEGFRNALYLAIDVYRNRVINEEISKDPLQHYEIAVVNPNEPEPNVEDLEDTEQTNED